ncbi:MAG: hypothetical protein E6Q42_04055 [Dechloromonas sp.]|nr:MAG: hypothetical protein E6Q42_04055 [Dechloromonas sp.]
MSDTLIIYFEALERLKKGRPTIVPKGTKITNDAVALEAGRGKGSIKKSRPAFRCLIEAIQLAATEQSQPKDDARDRLESVKNESRKYRALWEEALEREVSLLHELYFLKKQRGGNVIDLRGGNEK